MKSDLAADIMREIESYNEALAIEIDNASKGTAKKIAKELSETSPKDTGDYAADWAVKEVTGKNTLFSFSNITCMGRGIGYR